MSDHYQPAGSALTRETILKAFGSLCEELGRQGVTGELCLFGGTVMVLAFTARLSTKDVDALFQPAQSIRELARRIAADSNCRRTGLTMASKVLSRPGMKRRRAIFRSSRISALPCRCRNTC